MMTAEYSAAPRQEGHRPHRLGTGQLLPHDLNHRASGNQCQHDVQQAFGRCQGGGGGAAGHRHGRQRQTPAPVMRTGVQVVQEQGIGQQVQAECHYVERQVQNAAHRFFDQARTRQQVIGQEDQGVPEKIIALAGRLR
ncbi:hypothetical protein E4L96_05555 [Massilia arenosa]|uniref:Uncharacterized protein n=1 Tax=Zemynaea arenosa TaxID=2561931 RepID=A0A4Y9SP36_9BURK|nr:hypothetical protein [Massilia arenosa]TFW25209.1 hypothetical protein E4L96_05555 [Massilia arenosa]